ATGPTACSGLMSQATGGPFRPSGAFIRKYLATGQSRMNRRHCGRGLTGMYQAPDRQPRSQGGADQNKLELALLARIATRDAQAMHELYHLYHRRLARFLMRLTSRYALA